MWWLFTDYHSGLASAHDVATKFDELTRWGTNENPDIAAFSPEQPATAAEKQAAAGLLAIAAGR